MDGEEAMREILSMLAVLAVALGVVAAAVFLGGDRGLFVPVPETTVENFTREITTRRFDLAMKQLATSRSHSETPHSLIARFDPMLHAVGEINHVDAEAGWMSGDRASASATVEGERGTRSLDFTLVREHGLWKIDGLPELHVQ
jgi:hypothetical protein